MLDINLEKKDAISLNKILIFYGGESSEKFVSQKTAKNVQIILNKLKYQTFLIEFSCSTVLENIQSVKPDIVFNAVHGLFGEDGRLQSVLDILKIPYTHSGVTASSLCLNKKLTKAVVSSLGIDIARSLVVPVKDFSYSAEKLAENGFTKQVVAKPVLGGSSVLTKFIKDYADINLLKADNNEYDSYIIEEFIEGNEFSVFCFEDKAIGAIEIQTKNNIFDLEAKFDSSITSYIMPPKSISVQDSIYKDLLKKAERIHNFIGCKNISRQDFIYSKKDKKLYFLEVNTHPGLMYDYSLAPMIAKYFGISLEDIIESLVRNASYF